MNEASVGHQCPECVREGRRTQRQRRTAFGGGVTGQYGYVTITLIALNVMVALFAVASAQRASALVGQGFGGLVGSETPLHYWGSLIAAPAVTYTDPQTGNAIVTVHGVAGGAYYRLFTAMFLHFGLLHLLVNMWALWVLGRPLEALLGPARFLALYLVSGLGGNIAVYLFSSPTGLSAGASTALFGLFAALFLVLRRLRLNTTGVIITLVINLFITFSIPQISIAGHLGGLVTGAIVGAGLAYAPRNARTPVQIGVIAGTLVVLLVLTVLRTVQLNSG
jgi:membrane associated rhomboid family serine protease